MIWRDRAGTILAVLQAAPALVMLPPIALGQPAEIESALSIQWIPNSPGTNRTAVEVVKLSAAELQKLAQANWAWPQWQRLLSVYAEPADVKADAILPAMLGAYQVRSNAIRFEPQFPLEPGGRYRAVFRPGELPGARSAASGEVSAVFQPPSRRTGRATIVRQVYPSAAVLPENLLKFYVHFSAPMSRGHIYEHLHLLDGHGAGVELPFLELDEELWNPAMTRLTLFIDPGRIKRGVRPLEEIGPALEAGKTYTLVIDPAWQDANGQPLKEGFSKQFKAGPPDREPPDPVQWKIISPAAGTRAALTVIFPKPMDHALAQRVLHVATQSGEPLAGEVALEDQERRWVFTPARAWNPGSHRLTVETTIEDLAGNNIGKPFEVDLSTDAEQRPNHSTVPLTFEVR